MRVQHQSSRRRGTRLQLEPLELRLPPAVVSFLGSTMDTAISAAAPDSPQGSAPSLPVEAGAAGATRQALIRFESLFGSGAGQIPVGSTIQSASLSLWLGQSASAAVPVELHRLLVAWDPNTATWNSFGGNGQSGIQTDGAEALVAADGAVSAITGTGYRAIGGLAAALQAWAGGSANNGWVVTAAGPTTGLALDSSEGSTPARRPILTVQYSPPVPPNQPRYDDLAGAPPSPLHSDWFTWESTLEAQRLNRVPSARAVTYYFAQNGDDATGTGDIDQPWKTLVKAQAVLQSSSGDVRLRFRRGDVWREPTTLQIDKQNVTIDDYGESALAAPLFSRFTRTYTNGWSSGNGVWYRSESAPVGWLRTVNNSTSTILYRAGSLAELSARLNSWYYDAAAHRLYLCTASDPNATAGGYEASLTDGSGWTVTADNVRLENLQIQGSGLSPSGNGTGLAVSPGSGGEFVAVQVAVTWTGGRGISVAGSQTVATLIGCTAGQLVNRGGTGATDSGDVTPFDIDGGSGGNEVIVRDCLVAGGALPSADWNARPGGRHGRFGVWEHTNGPAFPPALAIALRTSYVDRGWQVVGGTNVFGPTAANIEDVRGYIVGESPADGIDSQPGFGSADRIYVNDTYTHLSAGRPVGSSPAVYSGGVYGSWAVNTTVRVDATQLRIGSQYALFQSTAPVNARFQNSRLEVVGSPGMTFTVVPSSAAMGPDFVIRNSVLAASGFGSATVGAALAGGRLDHNAYAFPTPPIEVLTVDPAGVLVSPTRERGPDHTPAPDDDPLFGSGTLTELNFDRTGAPRPANRNDIGPIVGRASDPANRNLPYSQLPGVGQPPSADDPGWFAWEERLQAARLANVPLSRSVTYYFSQSGDDLTGDGSAEHPYRSLNWANGILKRSFGQQDQGGGQLAAPNTPTFNPAGKDFTVAFWANAGNVYFSPMAKKPGSWSLSFLDNQHLTLWTTQDGVTPMSTLAWPTAISPGWHLYVVGYDFTNHQMRFSIDGSAALTATSSIDPGAGFGPLGFLGSNNWSMGTIADAAYWSSAPGAGGSLSNADVAALYQGGAGRRYEELSPALRSRLVAWWTLDDPSSSSSYADRLGQSPLTPTAVFFQVAGRPLSDIRLRFRGGDTWRDATALTVYRPNVTIDSYGVGSAYFTRFTRQYSAGWINVGGDLWKLGEPSSVAWVRPAADPLGTIYKREQDSASVADFAFSFFDDASGSDPHSGGVPTLYLNAGPGVNPNQVTGGFEAAPYGGDWFVWTDNVRLENLTVHGAGLSPTGVYNNYGLQINQVGIPNAEFVGVNLEFYFTGYHAIGHISDGAIATLVNCRAGLCSNRAGEGTHFSGDAIPYVSYAPTGGQEFLLADDEVSYGILPSWDWDAQPGDRFGSGVYQHGNGGADYPRLSIGLRTRYPDHPWQVAFGTSLYAAPAANLAGVRAYIVGEAPADGIDSQPGAGVNDRVYLNDTYTHLTHLPSNSAAALYTGPYLGGWVVNTTVRVDGSGFTPSGIGHSFYFSNFANMNMRLINCRFEVINNNGDMFNLISPYYPYIGSNFLVQNTIVSVSGSMPGGMGGGPQRLDHNAYYFEHPNPTGINTSSDPAPVYLTSAPRNSAPAFADPLAGAGAAGTLGFDASGRPRAPGRNDIGPISAAPLPTPIGVWLGNSFTRSLPLTPGPILVNSPIDRVTARFDHDVDLGLWSLSLVGLDGQSLAVNGFSYDPQTHTATWMLATPIAHGRVRLNLDTAFTADFRVLWNLLR